MTKSQEQKTYRVIFHNQGNVYEIYARSVSQGGLFGFIEVEEIVFGEKSQILVDPSEDALKKEFENTKRTYIPLHSIIRIDEMDKKSAMKPRVIPFKGDSEAGMRSAAGLYVPEKQKD